MVNDLQMWREGEDKGRRGRDGPLYGRSAADLQHQFELGTCRCESRSNSRKATAGQDCGTIVSSTGDCGKLIAGDTSLPRANSLRRSRALERMNGNRSNTLGLKVG
jgi:hypothetical protein